MTTAVITKEAPVTGAETPVDFDQLNIWEGQIVAYNEAFTIAAEAAYNISLDKRMMLPHDDYTNYMRDEFGIDKNISGRLKRAGKLMSFLSKNLDKSHPKPTNEAQCRELVKYIKVAVALWVEVVAVAGQRNVPASAALISEVAGKDAEKFPLGKFAASRSTKTTNTQRFTLRASLRGVKEPQTHDATNTLKKIFGDPNKSRDEVVTTLREFATWLSRQGDDNIFENLQLEVKQPATKENLSRPSGRRVRQLVAPK